METPTTPGPQGPSRLQHSAPLWRTLIGLGIALIVTWLFFSPPVQPALLTLIVAAGLDPSTTALITALLLITDAALASSLVCRQRFAVAIGAGITYSLRSLLPFQQQALLPHHDPGGYLETLNTGTLVHTLVVLFASGILCAYLGTLVGSALSKILFDPFWQLAQLIWHKRFRSRQTSQQGPAGAKAQPRSTWSISIPWVRLLTLLGLTLLSSNLVYLLFFSPAVGLYNPPAVSTHGTLIADSMVSPALDGQRRSFLVYLPPSYQDTATPERRYPTLYLFHGSPGSEYDWVSGGKAVQSADTLIGHREIPELIMVLPDGNGRSGETSEWGNSFDQKQLMENFVASDLVHYIDQKYRTIPQASDRAIGGFSMGAFGAMNIAVHHPDIFGSVISLAGYYIANGDIWGPSTASIQANSPLFVLPKNPQAWKLHIFLGAGTHDQPYYADTLQFIQKLKALHLNYTFDLEPGSHAWGVWETQLYHGLIWLEWG